MIFLKMISTFIIASIFAGEMIFLDLNSSHPNYQAISYLNEQGIIEGYPDGSFQPDKIINRAELSKIIISSIYNQDIINNCQNEVFSDVNIKEWYAPYICVARKYHLISGYEDGTFKPANKINYVEAAKIIVLGLIDSSVTRGDPWYQNYIDILDSYSAKPPSIQSLDQEVTRAEICEMIYQVLTQNKNPESLENDFLPPEGYGQGPDGIGPWNIRLMSAISDDGVHFTRNNKIITDQGDVPDIIIDEDNRIYLYYTAWSVGEGENETVVAISDDDGNTWTYKFLDLIGFDNMSSPVDPDIVLLADGTFRLYLTADPGDGQGPRTYYSEGSDGLHFKNKGIAFAPDTHQIFDPTVLETEQAWYIFARDTNEPFINLFGQSEDGKSFTLIEEKEFQENNLYFLMANGIKSNDLYRFYAFVNSKEETDQSLRSFVSKEGINWAIEDTVNLDFSDTSELESQILKEPAVIRLADETYLMIYATLIPESFELKEENSEENNSEQQIWCDGICDDFEKSNPDSLCYESDC